MAIFRHPPPRSIGGRQPDAPKTFAPTTAAGPTAYQVAGEIDGAAGISARIFIAARAAAETDGAGSFSSAPQPFPETFDPAQTSTENTLSNGNLTAVKNSDPGDGSMTLSRRGLDPANNYYWEIQIVAAVTTSNVGIGIANSSANWAAFGQNLGADPNTLGWSGDGFVNYNTSVLANIATFAVGDRVRISYDRTHNKLWAAVNGGAWNAGLVGTQDPATNQGGITTAGVTGRIFPAISLVGVNDQVDAKFAKSLFSFAQPSGFLSTNDEALSTAWTVAGEIDGAAGISARIFIAARAAAETDGAASISGPTFVWARAAGEVDGAGGINSYARQWWNNTAGEVDGSASISARAFLWARGAGEVDGAGGINSYARQWWNNTAGEIDGSAGVAAKITPTLTGRVDAAGFISSAPVINARAAGQINGAGAASSAANIWARASAETDGAGSVSSAPIVWARAAAKADGAGSISAPAILWARGAGEFDGVAGYSANALRVTFAAGEIDGTASIRSTANLWALLRGEVDGTGSVSSYANIWALLRGEVDGAGGISATAAGLVAQSWDPAHTAAGITLSNNNLTATILVAPTSWRPTFGLVAKTSGKYYWEIDTTFVNGTFFGVAIGNVASTLADFAGSERNSLGWFPDGSIDTNGAFAGSFASYASGDRVCFALDLDDGQLWTRVGASGDWNGNPTANPATNTAGFALDAAIYAGGGAVPAGNLWNTNDALNGKFLAGSWLGTAPSGFGPWVAGPALWAVAGEIDGAASLSSRVILWARAAAETDAAATVSSAFSVWARAAAKTDGAGSITAVAPVLWANTVGEIDAAASASARAAAWLTHSGLISGAGGSIANPLRVTFAGAELDGAGSISANPRQWLIFSAKADGAGGISTYVNIWARAGGKLDGAGGISGRLSGVVSWIMAGEIDGAATISSAPVVRMASSAVLAGAGTASAQANIWALAGSLLAGQGNVTANPMRVTYTGAQLDATGTFISGAMRASLGLSGEFDGTASFLPGALSVVVNAVGKIDGIATISTDFGRVVFLAGELDAEGSTVLYSATGASFLLTGHLDAFGGFHAGWQRFAEVVRVQPGIRSTSLTVLGRSTRVQPGNRSDRITKLGRTTRLPPKTRGSAVG